MRVQHNIKLTRRGRKDIPPDKGWSRKYNEFPISKLKIGYSFNTEINYDYGKTISIKNACRIRAKNWRFAVREWNGKIRVWRTK